MTPTGQTAPETAGWEHPTRLFRLTVVSGPDPWTIRYGCPVLTRAVHLGDGERASIQVRRAYPNEDIGREPSGIPPSAPLS